MLDAPAQWNRHLLDDVLLECRGGAWGIASETPNVGVIRTTNITDRHGLKLQDVAWRSIPDKQLKKERLRDGDIVMTKSNSIERVGCCAIFRQPNGDERTYISANFCQILRFNPEVINSEYGYFWLTSHSIQDTLKQQATGTSSSLQNINGKKIRAIPIAFPALDEQRRIVARIKECLKRVEEIEGLRKNATEEVEALTKSVLYETWQSSGILKAEKVALSELGKIITGNTPSRKVPEYFGGHQPWVTPGDFNGLLVTTGREFLSELGISEGNARIVPEGSVLVVCIGATIGKIALADCDLGINQQINAVTFDPEIVIPEFGYWACRALVPEIIDNASKNTLPILNKGRFSKLEIPVPNKKTQDEIAGKLNASEAAVSEMRRELHEATAAGAALRESILRKAFAGEL